MSIIRTDEDSAPAMCHDQTRRALILTALAAGACIASSSSVSADDDLPGSSERPQKADLLVFSEGDRAGQIIKPEDLKAGGPPVRAWPKDPTIIGRPQGIASERGAGRETRSGRIR